MGGGGVGLMTRRDFIQSLVVGATCGLPKAVAPLIRIEPGEPQLFVDDYLIQESTDLKRTLRMPKKDNGGNAPVIAVEREFGDYAATLEANGTILFDPKLKKWVMFALGFAPSMPG